MIINREQANKYYGLINELVDEYIDKWKIKPSRLKKYLRPGSERFENFLVRNDLVDIKGADRILKDIIEDRNSLESDGVITFESFFIFESSDFKIGSMRECLYKGIEKSNLDMEKELADYFDTNLGSIDVKDSDKHIFRLENWEGDDKSIVIYSKEDLEIIQENIFEYLYSELLKKEIELTSKIKIKLGEMISQDIFDNKMFDLLSSDKLVEVISDLLGDYKFENESSITQSGQREYFIWIKKD